MTIEVMRRWRNHYHCRHINRNNAYAEPCPEMAQIVYVDAQGVAYGACGEHLAWLITERARHGLLIPGIEVAA